VLLGLLLAFGAVLRLLRTRYGLPYIAHWDESLVVESGLRIIGGGGWDPYTFRYGSLGIYVSAILSAVAYLSVARTGQVSSLADYVQRYPANHLTLAFVTQAPGGWWLTRLAFSLFSLLTVWATYRIGRRLGLARAFALLGAALVCLSPAHVFQSTTATIDSVGVGFMTLALLAAVGNIADRNNGTVRLCLPGLAGGFGVATKFSFLPMACVVAVGSACSGADGVWARIRAIGLSFAGLVGAMLVASPYTLLSVDAYLAGVGAELTHYGFSGHGAMHTKLCWAVLPLTADALSFQLIGFDRLCLALLTVGVVTTSTSRKSVRGGVIVLLAAAAIQLWTLSRQLVFFDRSALPLLPILAVIVAAGAQNVWELWLRFVSRGSSAGPVFVLATLVPFAWVGASQTRGALRMWRFEDSRVALVRHLIDTVKPGEVVAIDSAMPLYFGDLRRARIGFEVVDPVLDPCWFATEPYDWFVTASDPGPGWGRPTFELPGDKTSVSHPYVSPSVRVFRRRNDAACSLPVGSEWYAPPELRAGPGLKRNRVDGTYELGFDGWASYGLRAKEAGEEIMIDLDVEAVLAHASRTGDPPELRVIVQNGDAEDVCWAVLKPVGARRHRVLTCRLAGPPEYRLRVANPATIEDGLTPPWLVSVHGVHVARRSNGGTPWAE
jgi:hypothetical protein